MPPFVAKFSWIPSPASILLVLASLSASSDSCTTLRMALPADSPAMPVWSIITSRGASILLACKPFSPRNGITALILVKPCSMLVGSTPR